MKQRRLAASTKIILDARYKKSKTYPVKLRVTYNRVQKYYPLKLKLSLSEWNKMKSNRPGDLKDKWLDLQAIEKRVAGIIEKLPLFSFELFEKKYLNHSEIKTVSAAFKDHIKDLRSRGRIGSAINYECAESSLSSFSPGLLLAEVDIKFITDYSRWMEENKKKKNTVSMYLRSLRYIINKAIGEGALEKDLYPFGKFGFKIPSSQSVKRALSGSELAELIDFECQGSMARAKDFWFLIYLCEGINVFDLCLLKYSSIKRNKIEYVRKKTVNTQQTETTKTILITSEIKDLLEKLGQGGDSYIFPILRDGMSPEQIKDNVQYFTKFINKYMKKIGEELKIDIPVTTYVARHSWASEQLRNGTSISEISKKMHNGNIKTTIGYFGSLSVEQEVEMAKAALAFRNNKQAKIYKIN